MLKLRNGEFQVDSINSVEDTKGNNGERGHLVITNLRLIWQSTKNMTTNLSIGLNCITSVNHRVVNSRLRQGAMSLVVMTRFQNTRFEFVFTSLVDAESGKMSERMFASVQAIYRSYSTSKLYRDLKLRGAIIREKELVMLPQEQIYHNIEGIWNLSSEQGNLGTFFITNIRVVWYAKLAENFNVSIPYIQMKTINTRNSKFGPALVVETTAASGGYILGFRADPPGKLQEVHEVVIRLWKIFSAKPIFGVIVENEAVGKSPQEVQLPRREDDVEGNCLEAVFEKRIILRSDFRSKSLCI